MSFMSMCEVASAIHVDNRCFHIVQRLHDSQLRSLRTSIAFNISRVELKNIIEYDIYQVVNTYLGGRISSIAAADDPSLKAGSLLFEILANNGNKYKMWYEIHGADIPQLTISLEMVEAFAHDILESDRMFA